MARMIPSTISPEVKSPAERKIFEWFKNDPMTKDWVVFHSLGIENHQTVVFGEIDFLVAASNCGVFALEVKGGRISREDGVWIYTDKYGVEHKKVRGPFEQASEGMYSVKSELDKRADSNAIKNTMCGYGVMFPDIEYENHDIDVAQSQIFDKRDHQYVGRYIKRLADYNKAKFKDKRVFVVYPSDEDIDGIVKILRSDFDKAVPLSTKVEYAENTLIKLTEEQYRCIDGLASNRRCLINGAAGTGKTILAIKNAKESVAEGLNIGFFCYNLLLEKELRRHFEDNGLVPTYVGSLTKYLEDMLTRAGIIDIKKVAPENIREFYKEELPSLALDYLTEHPVKFDKIIIDEAQDLLSGNYLFVIDALLEGGLKKGKWFFFGDFQYQTIYCRGSSYDSIVDLLEEEASFATFNLTINCRNTPNIQREMNKISGVKGETLNKQDDMPQVKYITFDEQDEEVSMVEDTIDRLIASGIKKEDITLLSPFKFEKSVASRLKYKIDKGGSDSRNITYSTIQGFKGLENSVIMLVDIQTYNKPDLMYVGMSRARSLLYIFETKHAKAYRSKL